MKLNKKFLFVLITVCLMFPLTSRALTITTEYTPPVNAEGLYPTPDDPNFPQPGHFMLETVGYTVDEVNDTVKYFRSDEYMNEMRAIRRQLQETLEQRDSNPELQAAVFPEVYARAQVSVIAHIDRLNKMLELNLSKPWLNDGICENIDDPCSTDPAKNADEKLKSDLKAFFNTQLIQFEKFKTQFAAAKTITDIQNAINSVQSYTDNQILRDQAKSIAARVFSQRLLNFSKYIQDLVLYVDCLAPRLGQAGFDVSFYQSYMASMGSRFKTDWYQTSEIHDSKRPWETFNFVLFDEARSSRQYTAHGAKWEYWTAHNVLNAPTCKGNTKCKEDTTMHMRAAKYNLQDMFHIFYGFYDRIQKQVAAGKKPTDKVLSECKFPTTSSAPMGGGSFGGGTNSTPFPWPSKTRSDNNLLGTPRPTTTRAPTIYINPTGALNNVVTIIPSVPLAIPTDFIRPTRRLTR
jgi:hypothetical protein